MSAIFGTLTIFAVLYLLIWFCGKNDADMADLRKHKGTCKNLILFSASFPPVFICLLAMTGPPVRMLYIGMFITYLLLSAYFDFYYKLIYTAPSVIFMGVNYFILILSAIAGADYRMPVSAVIYSVVISLVFRITRFGKGDIYLINAFTSALAVLSMGREADVFIYMVCTGLFASMLFYLLSALGNKLYRHLKQSDEKMYAYAPALLMSALFTFITFL